MASFAPNPLGPVLAARLLHEPPPAPVRSAVQRAAGAVRAPVAYLGLLTDRFERIVHGHGLPPTLALSAAIERQGSISERVARRGSTVEVPSVAASTWSDADRLRWRLLGFDAVLAAPVRLGGIPAGALVVLDRRPRDFEPATHGRLEALAAEADTALESWVQGGRFSPLPRAEALARLRRTLADVAPLVSLLQRTRQGRADPFALRAALVHLAPSEHAFRDAEAFVRSLEVAAEGEP